MSEKKFCLTDELLYPWDYRCIQFTEYDVYVPEEYAGELTEKIMEYLDKPDPLGKLAKEIANDFSTHSDKWDRSWAFCTYSDALDDYLYDYYHDDDDSDKELPWDEQIIVRRPEDVTELFVDAMEFFIKKKLLDDLLPFVVKFWTDKAVFKSEAELNEEQYEIVCRETLAYAKRHEAKTLTYKATQHVTQAVMGAIGGIEFKWEV